MKKSTLILGLVAVAGIAAASTLTVNQRTDTVNVFAERISLQDRFVSLDSALAASPTAMPALGTHTAPVEMGIGLPAARTAVARDHWTYTIVVKESALASAGSGAFSVRLLVDNALKGSVFTTQAQADAGSIEGVTATFDLGPELRADALYFLEIRPFTPTGVTTAYTLRSSNDDGLEWVGVGGAVNGQPGPSLPLGLGATLQLTAVNGDGEPHNIGIKSGGTLANPPGWSADIDAVDEQVTISWAPAAAGTYTYHCKYHSSMTGDIVVTAA